MSRGIFKTVILLFVAALLTYLSFSIVGRFAKKKAITTHTAQLPAIIFRGLDGQLFSLKSLSGNPVWLLYFNSECEFCQSELKDIQEHNSQLSGVKVVLVSSEKMATLTTFRRQYVLDSLQNVVLVQDSTRLCITHLGMTTTPSSLLYMANGQRIKKYSGAVKVSVVLKDFRL
jgi:peroxiredoxin